ncbi:hypothetical protein [Streptomyces sp. TLI_146]|uniref:hypothetical protein n=1 Tax=Streptomyces sp. TLI_146 TaxID=1938858 RepID=UPI000C6FF165|nr:hypothetical protein [Streptomyces sp. TLI_146]PKV87211.1 putative lipoprotein with Yx(FWY)xxD motif [Streptomyces sp. TLI_146]
MLTVHRIAVGAAAGTAVLALAATGCGSSNDSKTEKPSTGTTAPATPNPAAPTLSATEVDKVGTVVTDSNGYVLYRFDKDTAKPSHSNCLAACAAIWPPAPATDALSVKGIDKALVGQVTRPDGTKQLTLAGWPLYRYAKDDGPREAYGQGAGGTWFAITPTGAKATADTGGGTTSGGVMTPPGGSGY